MLLRLPCVAHCNVAELLLNDGMNMFDGGAASKVQANTGALNNQMVAAEVQQNTTAAIPQAASAQQVQKGRKMQLVGDKAKSKSKPTA